MSMIAKSRYERAFAFALGIIASIPASANPQGPNVVSGVATFATPNSQTLEVTNAPGAIINWQGFNIGVGETTKFIQQNAASAVLNRVVTPNPSQLLGSLQSNGHVFLINPAGILIGRDATVDTAGLVMSTLDIKNEDFIAGRYTFSDPNNQGTIVNHGYIKATPNGEVVLIAPSITNAPESGNDKSGLIEAPNGQLILAGGHAITISSLDDPNISFEVKAPDGQVVNLGQLLAKGGTASVLAGTIRHSGEINADSLGVNAAGHVVLKATDKVETTAASKITANASSGAGGTISIEGNSAIVGGVVDASGTTHGGTVHVLGDSISTQGATIAANASNGAGGDVRVGGDFQGGASTTTTTTVTPVANSKLVVDPAAPVHSAADFWGRKSTQNSVSAFGRVNHSANQAPLVATAPQPSTQTTITTPAPEGLRRATNTLVDAGTLITANGGNVGNGGNVVVWSDQHTGFSGTAAARAGDLGGSGGLLEVSGKATLDFAGSIDVGAPQGHAGTLLLDPRSITIIHGGIPGELTSSQSFAGDQFGSNFSVLNGVGGGRIVVTVQDAGAPGLTNAGKISVFDFQGNELGTLTGNASNEHLGSFGLDFVSNNLRFVQSPSASNGGLAKAGALILFDLLSGHEVGRTSGISANENFASIFPTHVTATNYVVQSPQADVNGITDAGSVVTVSGTTGLEVGRVNGAVSGDLLGGNCQSNVCGTFVPGVQFGVTAANTFLIRDPLANGGAGNVILASSLTGNEIGRSSGVTAGAHYGANINFFMDSNRDYLVSAPNDLGTAGTVVLANGSTGSVVGRVNGTASGDNFGSQGQVDVSSLRTRGEFLITASNADVGGLTDNGTVVLVNNSTGAEIGRTSGLVSNDHLGAQGEIFRPNGNYFIPNSRATIGPNQNAGTVILVSGTTGTRIGSLDGNATDESLGGTTQLVGGNLAVLSPEHTNPTGNLAQAGGIFVLADTDLGGGNIVNGQVLGAAANDLVGLNGLVSLGGTKFVVPVPNADTSTFTDNGSILLVDTSLSGNILVGQTDGRSDNEQLGANPFSSIIPRAGNYFALSPNFSSSSPGSNEGSVYLINGTTGVEIGHSDGNSPGEQFGSNVNSTGLLNGDLLVISPQHKNGGFNSGLIIQLDPTSTTSTIERGTGVFGGASNGDLDGAQITFVRNVGGAGNSLYYVVSAQNYTDDGFTQEGAVFVVDGSVGNIASQAFGNTASEQLGSTIDFSLIRNTGSLAVMSPTHGNGSNSGAVIFMSASSTASPVEIDGAPNDNLGSDGILVAPTGKLILPVPGADNPAGTFVDAGSVILIDPTTFAVLGHTDGTSTNEGFGAFGTIDTNSVCCSDFLVRSPNRHISNPFDTNLTTAEGAVVIVDSNTGSQAGAILGQNAGDHLGEQIGSAQVLANGNFLLLNPSATDGVNSFTNAGAVILVNGGSFQETGRFYGQTSNERLGSFGFAFERPNGNYVVPSPNAGASGQGAVYLGSGANGQLLGSVLGTAVNEHFGNVINDFSLSNGDLLVTSSASSASGFANSGTVVQLSDIDLGGGNIVKGRINGGSVNEGLGAGAIRMAPDNIHYFINSPFADYNGVDSGSFYFVDSSTGTLSHRIDGGAANDQLGNFGVINPFGSNLLITSPRADIGGIVDAGSVMVADSTGNILGRVNGNTASEQLGSNFQCAHFSCASNDIWLISPKHNNTAGTIFDIASVDLGGGNIIRHSISGNTAGDFLGNEGINTAFGTPNFFIRVPFMTVNGLEGAGSVITVDNTLTELGRVNGTSANEGFGGAFPELLGRTTHFAFASPNADSNGLIDNGSVKVIDATNGQLTGQTDGISTNEHFGNGLNSEEGQEFQLADGSLIVPSANATVNGLTNAGRVVELNTNGVLVKQVLGISQDERLGDQLNRRQFLNDGRFVFPSIHAALNGVADAGRLVVFDTSTGVDLSLSGGVIKFPDGNGLDFTLTDGQVQSFLASGAHLIFQANSDIVIDPNTVLTGSGGSISFAAGRSIIVQGHIFLPSTDLSFVANSSAASGADPTQRGTGTGDFILTDPEVVGKNITISAQNVRIFGGSDPNAVFAPQSSADIVAGLLQTGTLKLPAALVLALESLKVKADNIEITAGNSPGAFAALASFGEFSVETNTLTFTPGTDPGANALFLGLGGLGDFKFTSCVGCGELPLLTDPFLENTPRTGFFISGLLQNPTIDAILALLNQDKDKDKDDDKRNKKRKECSI